MNYLPSRPLWVAVNKNLTHTVVQSDTVTYKQVITSLDGITWAEREIVGGDWIDLVYSAKLDLFVAFGRDQSTKQMRVATSSDGVNWTYVGRIAGAYFQQQHNACAGLDGSGNALIVVPCMDSLASQNQVATSPDGVNWTVSVLPTSTPTAITADATWMRAVYNDKDLFIIISASGSGFAGVYTSANGTTWNANSFIDLGVPIQSICFEAVYGKGVFAASFSGNGIYTSTDGLSWTKRYTSASGSNSDAVAITFGNGLFVALGFDNTGVYPSSGFALTSPDGITWSSHSVPALINPSLDYVGGTINQGMGALSSGASGSGYLYVGMCFAGAETPQVYSLTSPDGVTWTRRTQAVTFADWTDTVFAPAVVVTAPGTGPATDCAPTLCKDVQFAACCEPRAVLGPKAPFRVSCDMPQRRG